MKDATVNDDEIRVLIAHYNMKMAATYGDNGLDPDEKAAAIRKYEYCLAYWRLKYGLAA